MQHLSQQDEGMGDAWMAESRGGIDDAQARRRGEVGDCNLPHRWMRESAGQGERTHERARRPAATGIHHVIRSRGACRGRCGGKAVAPVAFFMGVRGAEGMLMVPMQAIPGLSTSLVIIIIIIIILFVVPVVCKIIHMIKVQVGNPGPTANFEIRKPSVLQGTAAQTRPANRTPSTLWRARGMMHRLLDLSLPLIPPPPSPPPHMLVRESGRICGNRRVAARMNADQKDPKLGYVAGRQQPGRRG